MKVTVTNWEKFNPRSDRANHSWFRFENSFFTDGAIFSLSADAQRLFIFLCCEASKKGNVEIDFSSPLASALLKITESNIPSLLSELADCGRIKLEAAAPLRRHDDGVVTPNDGVVTPNDGVVTPNDGVTPHYERTNERTNVTDVTDDAREDGAPPPPPVLESEPEPPDAIISGDPLVREFLEGVTDKEPVTDSGQRAWVKLYDDRIWLEAEIKKAAANWISNGNRSRDGSPKTVYINRWLGRAQEYLKKAPAVAPVPIAGKAERPPPPPLAQSFDPITGDLKIWIAQ